MGTSPVGGAGEPAPVEADLTVCVVFFFVCFPFVSFVVSVFHFKCVCIAFALVECVFAV